MRHLCQLRRGGAWAVLSSATLYRLIAGVLALAGLTHAAGQPLHYTPYNFRRIFASEAVGNGLLAHIVSRLPGHKNINTNTQAYMAIFDEQLVRSYRSFLDARRAQRPEAE